MIRTLLFFSILIGILGILAMGGVLAFGSEVIADDMLAFTSRRDGNPEIYLLDVQRAIPYRLTNSEDHDREPIWSPNGEYLAYLSMSRRELVDLSIVNIKNLTAQRITIESTWYAPIAWSPDSQKIAYTGDPDGNADVFLLDVESGAHTRLTNHPADETIPASTLVWSPDGTRLTFLSNRAGNPDVFVVNVATGATENISDNPANDRAPVWSPDGTQLAYTSDRTGDLDIYIHNFEQGRTYNFTKDKADDNSPIWSPDGKRIAFVSDRGGGSNIYSLNIERDDLQRLTDFPTQDNLADWSTDGKQILFWSLRDGNNEIYLVDATGNSNETIRLTQNGADDWQPRWLPNN